jgi:hypothetical protein
MNPPDRPIEDLDDLTAAWQFVDGGHGYSAPQLFALLIDADGHVVPTIIHMYDEDADSVPDDTLLALLVDRLGEAVDAHAPGGAVAIMKARPGTPSMTDLDHRWCRALHRHLHAAPFDSKPLFFATDTSLGVVPPDVLVAAS